MSGYTQVVRGSQIDLCLGASHGQGLAGSRMLEGVVSVPIRACFALRVFGLS